MMSAILAIISMTLFSLVAGDSYETAAAYPTFNFNALLLLAIPALLLKAGLAAPIVLAIFVKIMIFLKLKMLLFLPLLLGGQALFGSINVSHESGETTSYLPPGRRKREVDIMEQLIGRIPFSEEELLENIFKVDTKRCGERLLCEVASSEMSGATTEEGKAMVDLFNIEGSAAKAVRGHAMQVYSKALTTGLKGKNCATKYSSCHFNSKQMLNIVQALTKPTKPITPKTSQASKLAFGDN